MRRNGRLYVLASLALVFLAACELAPSRPEDVFTVYREKMRAGELREARKLLSPQSAALAESLAAAYKLDAPPENLALLNILDPQSAPIVTVVEDAFALLNVRTLRGAPKMIRLVRETPKSPWKINLNEELTSLETFLEAQAALETMREKAGDYAASWKAFHDQLERINIPEEPSAAASQKPSKPSPKKPGSRRNNQGRAAHP
ncbi:MAG: hypothetical protein ACP5M0_08090 [Desulfomonilaceae bacterium]